VRHKYAEELPRWLSAALRAPPPAGAGFAEDRGAALGDARVFKHQHDLGQNLLYMHVFPPTAAHAPEPASVPTPPAGLTVRMRQLRRSAT
jgi:hypothetical protein